MREKSFDRRRAALKAARRFGAFASALLIGAAIILVAAVRFDFLGASMHINLAMALGTLGSIAVGVGLMALTFYSSRSGADDEAGSDTPDDGAL